MDRVLPFQQQIMIRFHLQMCKYCARFRDQLLLTRKAIRTEEDFDEELRPSESSFSEPRERIKQALRNQSKKNRINISNQETLNFLFYSLNHQKIM